MRLTGHKQQARRFTDYVWQNTRSSVVLSWTVLTVVSIFVYADVLIVLKNKQLHANLKIAAETVNQSLQAGDWPLALGHLRFLEKSGRVFEIDLKDKTGGTNIAGPFGTRPFGVGKWCAREESGDQWVLTGCMRVLDSTEVYTFAFFLVFSGVAFLFAIKFFQAKMLLFVGKVSENLSKIPALEVSDETVIDVAGIKIMEVEAIRQHIVELLRTIEKASASQALAHLAAQVAHDIRSPLAALDAVTGSVNKLPEDERLIIRGAVNRIKDIANHLLEKNRNQNKDGTAENIKNHEPQSELPATVLLSSLIEPLITEKRLQFRSQSGPSPEAWDPPSPRRTQGIDISANLGVPSYGLFATVEPREFKRVLSNLINNSVEALKNKGSVILNLSSDKDWVLLKVQDNGPGIPKEILAKLGQRGQTHGKAGGSGLGLYHARTSLESWGGSLELDSRFSAEGGSASGGRGNDEEKGGNDGALSGTTVTIRLPRAPHPNWFVPELQLKRHSPVVILDDDSTIHQVWQGRLESLRVHEQDINVQHCSTPNELREWVKANPQTSARAIYLTDFELLGFKETGLALVEELNLGPRAILVTSRYEEERILKDCIRLGVRLIPKNLVGFVPIRITAEHAVLSAERATENLDSRLRGNDEKKNERCAVLIDDDKLVQMTWRMAAKSAGVELSSFNSPDDFEKAQASIPRDTPIYLDSSFPNGQKGEDYLARLKELGFTKITLATGFEADTPALKALGIPVIGKEPPFCWRAPALAATIDFIERHSMISTKEESQ